jgi:hypothetical protein
MVYVARFVAGLFLANGVPHFVNGVSGNRFQSPFASPPGVGESPALVNVLWGFTNLVIGFVLLTGIGEFRGGMSLDLLFAGLGALLMSLVLAWHFGRVRGKSG